MWTISTSSPDHGRHRRGRAAGCQRGRRCLTLPCTVPPTRRGLARWQFSLVALEMCSSSPDRCLSCLVRYVHIGPLGSAAGAKLIVQTTLVGTLALLCSARSSGLSGFTRQPPPIAIAASARLLCPEGVAQIRGFVSRTQRVEPAGRTLAIWVTGPRLHRQSPGRGGSSPEGLCFGHNQFPARRLCATTSLATGSAARSSAGGAPARGPASASPQPRLHPPEQRIDRLLVSTIGPGALPGLSVRVQSLPAHATSPARPSGQEGVGAGAAPTCAHTQRSSACTVARPRPGTVGCFQTRICCRSPRGRWPSCAFAPFRVSSCRVG
jgi:hypothetical protein